MADNVVVSTAASGATIAAENIGSVEYQRVKLVQGDVGSSGPIAGTSGVAAPGQMGLVVAPLPGQSVTIQQGASVVAQVSGAVQVSGPVLVTGAVSISALPPVAGTVQVSGPVEVSGAVSVVALPAVSLSVSAALGTVITILGTQVVTLAAGGNVTLVGTVGASLVAPVSVSGIVPVTTQASVSVAGLPVWMSPTQQVAVGNIASLASLSTILNPVSVTGVSLNVVVSGPVSISAMPGVSLVNVVPVTTAASVSVSGLPVWLNPTQQVVVSGLAGHSITGSVNVVSTVLVTGSVGVSGTAVVSLATGGTLATLLGTVAVNVVAGGAAPGTTAATQSAVSAQVVWLAPTQTLNIISTVGTVLGTVAVNVVAGGAAPGTTAATQSAVSAQVVWLAPTQTLNVVSTVGTVLGTVAVNVVAGGAAPGTTAATQSAISAQVVWLAPTQTMTVAVSGLVGHSITGSVNIVSTAIVSLATGGTVTLAGTVGASIIAAISISGIVPVTTAASVSVTGLPVWLNPTQSIGIGNVASIASLSTILNPVSVTGTSLNVVVSGPVSISAMPGVSIVNVVPVTTQASVSVTGLPVWMSPTQSVAVAGLTPVTTQVSVSVTGLAVWWNPTAQVVVSGLVGQSITGSVNIVSTAIVSLATGGTVTLVGTVGASLIAPVSISGIVPVTTAASVSVTGLPVWLNPTQSIGIGNVASIASLSTILNPVSVTGTSLNVVVSGPVSISAMPGVSIVNVVPVTTAASVSVTGLPVWLSPTQSVAVAGLNGVTTQVSVSVTGLAVWWNPTAQVVVSGLAGHSVTGSVNIVSTAIVSLATGGTVTLVGTVGVSVVAAVSISGIVPVTTAASVSVTGLPVWLNPTQSIAVVVAPGLSVALSSNFITTTSPASGATGLVVYNADLDVTTGTPAVNASGQMVWVINQTAVSVSVQVSGSAVATTTQIAATGAIVWLAPTQTMTVAVSGLSVTSGHPDVTATGQIVRAILVGSVTGTVAMQEVQVNTTGQLVVALAPTQAVSMPTRQAFQIVVSSTAAISAGSTLLMTVYTGSTMAGAGQTQYVVPAGKAVVINAIYGVITPSASTAVNTLALFVVCGASGSLTTANWSTAGQVAALYMSKSGVVTQASIIGLNGYVNGGVTMGLWFTAGTSVSISQFLIQGYLEG